MTKYEQQFNDYQPTDDIYPETFHQQIRDDIAIPLADLDKQSLRTTQIHHKYLAMTKRAEVRLEKAETEHLQVLHGLYLYYEGRAPDQAYKDKPQQFTLTKIEIERHIKVNPAFVQSIKIVNLWKQRVSFLKEITTGISKRSFHISNAIKFLQFNQGEI